MEELTVEQRRKGSVEALINMVMYIHQNNMTMGMTVDESKEDVKSILLDLVDRYSKEARIEFPPSSIINPITLFDGVVSEVKELYSKDPSHAVLLNKLVMLRRMIKEG